MNIQLLVLITLFLFGCSSKEVTQIHRNTSTFVTTAPSGGECDRSWSNYYGHYDEALEEWVYPSSINRRAYGQHLQSCRYHRGQDPYYRTRVTTYGEEFEFSESTISFLENTLFTMATRQMNASKRGQYITNAFQLGLEDLRACGRGEITRGIVQKISTRLSCSRLEATHVARALLKGICPGI